MRGRKKREGEKNEREEKTRGRKKLGNTIY
jgi:hypothetical protein